MTLLISILIRDLPATYISLFLPFIYIFFPFPLHHFSFPFTYKYTHPILISILTFLHICAAVPFKPFLFLSPFPFIYKYTYLLLTFPFPFTYKYIYLSTGKSVSIYFVLTVFSAVSPPQIQRQTKMHRDGFISKNGVGLRPAPKFFSFSLYI